jgi:hypothetical protein
VIDDLTLAHRERKWIVMPAWMAGIQVRRMRPETSMSAWIPALHCWNDTIEESSKANSL